MDQQRMNSELIEKYNVPGPRYTSYPTVPYWHDNPTLAQWKDSVVQAFNDSNEGGISLYIHLPFCERLCTFCGCNKRITVNHKVEDPYIDTVLKEYQLYLDFLPERPKIREIHLGGGTPTFFTPDNLKRLIEGILSMSDISPDYEFGYEGHPNVTTEDHIQALAELGFTRASFGVQDFDPEVQAIINRHQTYEQTKRVTDWSRKHGFESINFDLVFGLPLQTMDSIIDSVERVKTLLPERIAYYSYAHVPWVSKAQRRYTEADLPSGEYKRQMYEQGRSQLEAAGYKEIGMDHFALPSDNLFEAAATKTLHRNFMGYTPRYTKLVLGLGASSISDSWGAFAQNRKVVEDYQQTVQHGELPIFRGHCLTEEDKILRQHILNVMCHYETSWSSADVQHPSLRKGIKRLKEMEKDGLVRLGADRLDVTEAGRPFIRNICMALDQRLWEDQPETELFSKVI